MNYFLTINSINYLVPVELQKIISDADIQVYFHNAINDNNALALVDYGNESLSPSLPFGSMICSAQHNIIKTSF